MALIGFWTPEKVATLREGADEGLSSPEIAERLSTSKGAVIGYCDRNNIKLHFRAMAAATHEAKEADRKERLEVLLDARQSKRNMKELDRKLSYGYGARPRASDYLPYTGPTSMERLDALHRKMDAIRGVRPFKWGYLSSAIVIVLCIAASGCTSTCNHPWLQIGDQIAEGP